MLNHGIRFTILQNKNETMQNNAKNVKIQNYKQHNMAKTNFN